MALQPPPPLLSPPSQKQVLFRVAGADKSCYCSCFLSETVSNEKSDLSLECNSSTVAFIFQITDLVVTVNRLVVILVHHLSGHFCGM